MENEIEEWKGQLSSSKSAYFNKSSASMIEVSCVDSPEHVRKNSNLTRDFIQDSPKASPARRTTITKTFTEQERSDLRNSLNCLRVSDLTEIRSF